MTASRMRCFTHVFQRRAFVLSPLWLSACGILGPDVQVTNRRLLDPVPAEYPSWYEQVQECLGLPGDYDAITWYVADDVIVDGVPKAGILRFPHAITMHIDFIHNPVAVKHEMVHHVRQLGDELHGTTDFDRCS